MRRLLLVIALVLACGLGALMGALLPPAHAQWATLPPLAAPVNPPRYDQRGQLLAPVYYLQNRWQVTVIPGPPAQPLLVDTYSGESFLLQPARTEPTGYYWARLERR